MSAHGCMKFDMKFKKKLPKKEYYVTSNAGFLHSRLWKTKKVNSCVVSQPSPPSALAFSMLL